MANEEDNVSANEAEELFMASAEDTRRRIGALLPERWKELVAGSAPLGRRARTMGTCAALEEATRLAQLARHAEDEETARLRGERMLADVVAEASAIVQDDRALKANAPLRDAVQKALPTPDNTPTAAQVAQLQSLLAHVQNEYLHLSEGSLCGHFGGEPSPVEFEETLEQLAAHARNLGWSDEGLASVWEGVNSDHSAPDAKVRALVSELGRVPTTFGCGITVALGDVSPDLFNIPSRGMSVAEVEGGYHITVQAKARDHWAAARAAMSRVAVVVGAPNVFHPKPSHVAGGTVSVSRDSEAPREIDASSNRNREHHNPWKGQIRRIIEVASRAEDGDVDTLYDAIRNHQRSLHMKDPESAFILSWSAIERLCTDPRRPEPMLRSTADLVSGTLAFSKIRREVMHFADALTPYLKANARTTQGGLHTIDSDVIRADREVVPHEEVLKAAIGTPEEAKQFCSSFYDDVRLTQWFFRFRRLLASPGGGATRDALSRKVPQIIADSRRRTRWQVLRLYRARNHIAHGGSRPVWLSDLLRHADSFLTNSVAICLNYADDPSLSSRDILAQRCGWLDTYLALASTGEPRSLSIDGLLKPSNMFRA